MTTRLNTVFLSVLLLVTLSFGCTPVAQQFVGNRVTNAAVVTIQPGGPHADSWETFDVIIDYQYHKSGDLFVISGTAQLTQRYEILYSRLRDLKVYLFFLDDDQRVLDTSMIARSLSVQIDQQMSFKQSFNLPTGATHISFGYEGLVTEGKMDFHSFYLLPLSK
jgi:hypothetical protein